MNGASSLTQHLFDCPICGTPVSGRLTVTVDTTGVTEIDPNTRTVNAQVKVTGIYVTHHCTPKPTR